jgi:hypothetical protein
MDAINTEVGLIKNVLSPYDFDRLRMHFKDNTKLDSMSTDVFGRKMLGHQEEQILQEFSELLLPKVREYFRTKTCVPSYTLFAEYSDETISLEKHRDVNACTYTLDLVLYQGDPWALFIDGKAYTANPNEAILFMGEEYEHWRETLYNNTGKIGVVFFHYVEPDHWFITEPKEKHDEIRQQKAIERNLR